MAKAAAVFGPEVFPWSFNGNRKKQDFMVQNENC